MAYANLVAEACSDKTDLFCQIRDFICKRSGTFDHSSDGIGWTLSDSSYAVDEDNPAAGDYFVISSTGENDDLPFYIKFFWYSTTHIGVQAGLYWDGSSNAFASASDTAEVSECIVAADSISNFDLWIYGNLDGFFIVNNATAGAYRAQFFGRLDPISSSVNTEVLTTTAASYSTGSDVSIIFYEALPSNWVEGAKLYAWGDDGTDLTVITIKTVDSGSKTITADLAADLSGSSLCYATRHLGVGIPSGSGSIGNLSMCMGLTDDVPTNPVSASAVSFMPANQDGGDPDFFYGAFILSDIFFVATGVGFLGKLPGAKFTPDPASGDVSLVNLDTLTDLSSVSWRFFDAYDSVYVAIKEV